MDSNKTKEKIKGERQYNNKENIEIKLNRENMKREKLKQLVLAGGLCGCLSVISYFCAAFIPIDSNALAFFLIMLFPVLGIIFFFSLKEYVNSIHPNFAIELSFVFSMLGFTMLAVFISAQLAVQIGVDTKASSIPYIKEIKTYLRLIDMGIDVAWDFFICTGMILFSIAFYRVKPLKWWGFWNMLLGLVLLILNVITFPEPPNTAGLIDLGPLCALSWFFMGIHLMILGFRMKMTQ